MITIESKVQPLPLAPALISRAADEVLSGVPAWGDLTVVLADDAQIRDLNRAYRGIDEPTDVLSFPAAEKDPDTGRDYLGDVIICLPQAKAQAAAAGHSLEVEVQVLVIHGVLHLLGHDHAGPVEKERMWAAQAAALDRLGLQGINIGE
jgi:probable rRNA maturation factor